MATQIVASDTGLQERLEEIKAELVDIAHAFDQIEDGCWLREAVRFIHHYLEWARDEESQGMAFSDTEIGEVL